MKTLERLLLLLSLLPACGTQLVEFPADGGRAANPDVRVIDAALGPDTRGMDAAMNPDAANPDAARDGAGPNPDGFNPDVRIVDGGTPDVRLLDGGTPDVGIADGPGLEVGDVGMPPDGPIDGPSSACRLMPVTLRTAANFTVLAGSTVTNTGLSIVTGDLGVSPGSAVTGFPPGVLVGTQHAMNPTSAQGIADLTTAYNEAAGLTLCPITRIGDLGGLTLPPGLYKSTSSIEITTADLTLDGMGDPDAVFIFQIASTLTTGPGRQVLLIGGARAANVFWQVGTSATFGSTTSFQGTVMADQAITMNTGARLAGRLLARIAAVSLDFNIITPP